MLFFVSLFAFTGLFLSHSQWRLAEFWDSRQQTTFEHDIVAPAPVGDLAEARDIMRQLGLDETTISERPGTVIGRYKLLEQIGEGGFGVVYVAEQQEPVRRQVALKIIKLGMDTRQVLARFEADRQALALMDHPLGRWSGCSYPSRSRSPSSCSSRCGLLLQIGRLMGSTTRDRT